MVLDACLVMILGPLIVSPGHTVITPSWLVGHRELLPVVSKDAIAAMRTAWPSSLEGLNCCGGRPSPAYYDSARMIAGLGSDAAKALIWLYAEDAPSAEPDGFRPQRNKYWMLSALVDDQAAVGLLLPLFRARLDWAQQHLKAGTLDRTWFPHEELTGIENVLTAHGTDEEFRRVFELRARLREFSCPIGTPPLNEHGQTFEQQWRFALSHRDRQGNIDRPYHLRWASVVESQTPQPIPVRIHRKSFLATLLGTDDPSSKPNRIVEYIGPHGYPIVANPSMPLVTGSIVGFGCIIAIWFLLPKRRRSNRSEGRMNQRIGH